MSTSTKRFIENIITFLILVLLLTLLTDASSQVFSVVGGFFGGKIIADILTLQTLENKGNKSKKEKQKKKTSSDKELTSFLTGKVIKVLVSSGSNVKKGDVLFIVESCKMEMEILSPVDGLIQEVYVSEGDIVVEGKALVRFY